jgi:hypothetical protein
MDHHISRYVLDFSSIIFLQGFFVYSPPPVHVYIYTCAIYNMV